MSRSFRRFTTASNANVKNLSCHNSILHRTGTKPWIDGLTLTSTGLKELDGICGGGQTLGTSIVIEEDRWTQDLTLALAKYWVAEAISQKQRTLFVSTDHESSDHNLPSCLTTDILQTFPTNTCANIPHQGVRPSTYRYFYQMLPKERKSFKTSTDSLPIKKNSESVINTIKEEFDTKEEIIKEEKNEIIKNESKASDDLLLNAWQYKKSVQRERSGIPSNPPRSGSITSHGVFCHSYDLYYNSLSPLDKKNVVLGHCPSCPVHACQQLKSCAIFLFQTCINRIKQEHKSYPNDVIRFVFLNPPLAKVTLALPLLVSYIRYHSLPVVFLVTTRPWFASSPKYIFSLRRTCDASFKCDSFASLETLPPAEFDHLDGILTVQSMALQTGHHFSNISIKHRLTTNRFGIRRDRRKLLLQLLHLPAQKDSHVGKTVDMGCMANLTNENKNLTKSMASLDF